MKNIRQTYESIPGRVKKGSAAALAGSLLVGGALFLGGQPDDKPEAGAGAAPLTLSDRAERFKAQGEGLTAQDITRLEGNELIRVAGCMLADPVAAASDALTVTRQPDLGQLRLEFRSGGQAGGADGSHVVALVQFAPDNPLMHGALPAGRFQEQDMSTFNVVAAQTVSAGRTAAIYEDGGNLLDGEGYELTADAAMQWGQTTEEVAHRVANSAGVAC